MTLRTSEIQGQLALQHLTKRQRALSVLRKSDGPGRFTVEILVFAALAAVADFLLERTAVGESVASALAWLGAAVAWGGMQQWRIQRRLEAVIELLELDEDGRR